MDYAACHVIFCDSRSEVDTLIWRERENFLQEQLNARISDIAAPEEVRDNVRIILTAFREVFLCRSGMACSNRLRQLEESRQEGFPVVVFLDIDPNADFAHRLSREATLLKADNVPREEGLDEYYGLGLLKHLVAETFSDAIEKLVIPIAVVRGGKRLSSHSISDDLCLADLCESLRANIHASDSVQFVEPRLLMKCLDAGAVDAFNSPLTPDRLQQIIVAAYKAHLQHAKEKLPQLNLKRIRKRSWVGIEEERPYAYLRESMVSSLMNNICRPEVAALGLNINAESFAISAAREDKLRHAIGTRFFSAHEFSDDELLYGAFLILSHCLKTPGLEKWRISDKNLHKFLLASRSAYNSFVLYHNFRHVVDVLQALFYSLLQIGALPAYPSTAILHKKTSYSSITRLLGPFEALVLLVSAIGHDVGHPGVNNAFLVTLKAPLAQLYNDKSVLEAFHCAAYSQILRRHWKSIYDDAEFRRLLINTILATDMGVHPEYMANLGNLQEKLHHKGETDSWTAKSIQSNKDLVLGLLIKCADISNVARPFDTALQWAQILQKEFARQGEMERDVGMESTLFGGPPELGNLMKLANSQIGFMNFFSLPLFEGVADIMPELHYAVDEIVKNKSVWEQRIDEEKRKEEASAGLLRHQHDGAQSPRSASPERAFFAVSPIALHQEGLPATGVTPEVFENPEEIPAGTLPSVKRKSLLDGSDSFFTPPASPKKIQPLGQNIPERLVADDRRVTGNASIESELKHTSLTRVDNAASVELAYSAKHTQPLPESATSFDHNCTISPSRNSSQNFSRPYSHQHSAQPSCAATRSSASRAPTFSSVNHTTSPTETQATSFGDNSEVESSAFLHESIDPHPTTYSTPGAFGITNEVPSRGSRASVSIVSESVSDTILPKVRPLTGDATSIRTTKERVMSNEGNLHQVKRKSSRWKFDFWRRRRQIERDAEGRPPGSPETSAQLNAS